MGRVTVRRPVVTYSRRTSKRRVDALAAEEPLELRVGGKALTVTMRTPGHDVELAHGFLLSEGVVNGLEDISVARFCEGTGPDGLNTYNVLDLTLAAPNGSFGFSVPTSIGRLTTGALNAGASFDTDLSTTMTGQLGANGAVVFTADSGTLSGVTFVVVDGNGVAGYQAGLDYVIRVDGTPPPVLPGFII